MDVQKMESVHPLGCLRQLVNIETYLPILDIEPFFLEIFGIFGRVRPLGNGFRPAVSWIEAIG